MKTFERRFLFVTGKGGVGKTTVAAGLARALSRRGRRVLLAATDSTPYRELLPDARWEDDPAPCGERSFTVRLEQGTGYIEADLTQVSAGDIGQGVATVQVRSGHMGPA